MKIKVKEILEKLKEKMFFKKIINFFKTNWKKVALIAGAVIVVAVIVIVSHSIRANNTKKDVINQLNGKTFECFEENDSWWRLESYTFQEDGKYIKDYYYYHENSDFIDHTSYDGTANIKVSLFGKVTLSRYEEIIFNDGEIEAIKSSLSDDIYEIVEISHLKKIAVDVFCELTEWKNSNYGEMIDTIYKDYDVTCTAVEGSDTKYVITFEGKYYPDKAFEPNYTKQGTLSVEVDIVTKTGKVLKDDGIRYSMKLYLFASY